MTALPELDSYIARREDVLARVRALLVERLHVERDPDTIDPDTPLFGTGLGLDSVDAVEMVVSLEDAFGLRLPDDALGRRVMRTVGKLVDLVLSYEDAVAAGAAEGAASEGAGDAAVAAGAAEQGAGDAAGGAAAGVDGAGAGDSGAGESAAGGVDGAGARDTEAPRAGR